MHTMKKTLSLTIALCIGLGMAYAYDFSHTYLGKTLYYKINPYDTTLVSVVAPVTSGYYSYVNGDVVIPDSIMYNGVQRAVISIEYHAFEQCVAITSISIPLTVTTIYGEAFRNCTGLTSVTIPNSISFLDYSIFYDCSNLSSVTLPNSLTQISSMMFAGCTSLSSISLPDSLTTISSSAFSHSGLTSITIPRKVTDIGPAIFSYCNNLNSIVVEAGNTRYDSRNNCNAIIQTDLGLLVQGCGSSTIPNGTRVISPNAFEGFSGITSIVIPDSVVSIGEYAFYNCSNLNTVTIGESVSSIAGHAFDGCAISELHCKPTTPPTLSGVYNFSLNGYYDNLYQWHWSAFIFIPCGSLPAYQTASGWSGLTELYRFESIYTVNASSAGHGTVNVIQATCDNPLATLTATPATGYTFVRWSDNNTDNPRTISLTHDTTLCAFFNADENTCPTITSLPWNNIFDQELTCWDTYDEDGDGYNWTHYQGYAVSESYSYFDNSGNALSPDNWLISRRIQIPATGNSTLSWNARGLNDSYYNEHYSVYISTTGNNPSDFTTALYSETINIPNGVSRSVNLQNYKGQTIRVAFRHHNTSDVFVLGISSVKITGSTQGIDDADNSSFNVYASDNTIFVEGAGSEEVCVYDILGQKVDGGHKQTFKVPNSGVYVVKVGNAPAQRVVVIK